MVGWHHRLDGHEFDQALGVGDGQGSLVCYYPWCCKQSDKTERLNRTELIEKKRPIAEGKVRSHFDYRKPLSKKKNATISWHMIFEE